MHIFYLMSPIKKHAAQTSHTQYAAYQKHLCHWCGARTIKCLCRNAKELYAKENRHAHSKRTSAHGGLKNEFSEWIVSFGGNRLP